MELFSFNRKQSGIKISGKIIHMTLCILIRTFSLLCCRLKKYKLLKLDDGPAEMKQLDEKNRDLRNGLTAMKDQFPQFGGNIKRISNSLIKLKH